MALTRPRSGLRLALLAALLGAGVVASGWVASLLPHGPTGAWAAVTLFPGWFVFTVVTGHAHSQPLDLAGGVVVSALSWLFWTGVCALAWHVATLRRRSGTSP